MPKRFQPRSFWPSPWAPGPHLQTVLARTLRPRNGFPYTRERIETSDGDFLDLDWGPNPGRGSPLAVVLHGLEGSSLRGYVRSVCAGLLARGIQPAALNFRGCSGEPNRVPTFYHSGATADPAYVLAELRRRHPGRAVGAVGFSLGGNVLLKLLGEREDGGAALADAAVAISVPYDLSAGSTLLEGSPAGRAYAAYFLHSLRRKVRAKAGVLAERVDLPSVYKARTLRRFDDLVTAPLHGFEDAAHYYHESSSMRYLDGIGVPTLLVHAADDPFLPKDAIPRDEARANPHLTLLLHDTGGHVGFLEGSPWKPRFWADEQAVAFLAGHLGAAVATAS